MLSGAKHAHTPIAICRVEDRIVHALSKGSSTMACASTSLFLFAMF
jgi:hypothetical protein